MAPATCESRTSRTPDIIEPTDALVAITRACVCGSDLWPYKKMEHSETGRPMGHELIGIVEAVGADVHKVKPGHLVVAPFAFSDGTCVFCREGLHTSCIHGGFFGSEEVGGAQAEAVRVPQADGTLVVLPVGKDDALMPSLLTLSDVMGRAIMRPVSARVGPGKIVAVVGDGAVGLCGVIAARRLGAEQIIMLGRHPDRIALAKKFGATDIVSERGDEADRARARTYPWPRRSIGSRMRRSRTIHANGPEHRSSRRRSRQRRRSTGSVDSIGSADVLQQRHHRRRACSSTRLHRGSATRCS